MAYGPVNTSGASKSDLEQAGGLVAQPEPPENVKKGWIDTGNHSVLKYYDPETETWKPVGAVWG